MFNFYRPGFVAPGTNSGDANLTAPEFQIVNQGSAIGYLNFITTFAFDVSQQRDKDIETYSPRYTDELTMINDLEGLVDHLDDLLTGGRMSAAEKTDILDIISTIEIRTDTSENTAEDQEEVVQTAVTLVLNSPSFAIVW